MDFANPDIRFTRAPDQLSCELDGEIAILNLDSKLYFGLKDVGAVIWRELETSATFDQLIDAVLAEFEVERERCAADVAAFLADLDGKGLIRTEQAAA